MPRRTLWILTALVLAVHWLELCRRPLAGRLVLRQQAAVFTTRSVAAPPPGGSGSPALISSSPAAASLQAAAACSAKPRKAAPASALLPQNLPPRPSERADVSHGGAGGDRADGQHAEQ